jgi:16S rRNA (cytidine1402-2'-O)-methyltransferase
VRTLVFFEAPHRLGESLLAMVDAFGADREAAVCRELTKTYEEVRRGPLAELATWAAAGVRGEITVVVSGAVPRGSSRHDDDGLAALVAERVSAGMSRKEAVAEVVDMTGEPRNRVYAASLPVKPTGGGR